MKSCRPSIRQIAKGCTDSCKGWKKRLVLIITRKLKIKYIFVVYSKTHLNVCTFEMKNSQTKHNHLVISSKFWTFSLALRFIFKTPATDVHWSELISSSSFFFSRVFLFAINLRVQNQNNTVNLGETHTLART